MGSTLVETALCATQRPPVREGKLFLLALSYHPVVTDCHEKKRFNVDFQVDTDTHVHTVHVAMHGN